jgi:hypothetical protein
VGCLYASISHLAHPLCLRRERIVGSNRDRSLTWALRSYSHVPQHTFSSSCQTGIRRRIDPSICWHGWSSATLQSNL